MLNNKENELTQNMMRLSNAENRSVPQRRAGFTPTAMPGISTLTGLVPGGDHVKRNPKKEQANRNL